MQTTAVLAELVRFGLVSGEQAVSIKHSHRGCAYLVLHSNQAVHQAGS